MDVKQEEEKLNTVEETLDKTAEAVEKLMTYKKQCEQSFALRVGKGVDPVLLTRVIGGVVDIHTRLHNDIPDWGFRNPEEVIVRIANIVHGMQEPAKEVELGSRNYWGSIYSAIAVAVLQGLYQIEKERQKEAEARKEDSNNETDTDN
jgi:flagellar biosynthesis chaperone FliJ